MCGYTNATIIILVILLVWLVLIKPMYESFLDITGTTFIPINEQAYGLRGDRLSTGPVDPYFYPRNRNIRLSDTNTWMYQSRIPINQEPNSSTCQQTPCPLVDGFDKNDSCWSCPAPVGPPVTIPNMTAH